MYRIRRVKCDEKKPACQRCLSTGRVCDGYGIWAGWNRHTGSTNSNPGISGPKSLSSHNMPVPLNGSTREELVYFDFFCRCTALKLPGVFESAFWEHLIFQASSSEPAVLHAVIALASAHRSEETTFRNDARLGHHPYFKSKNDAPRNAHDRFALQQYNKAICDLQSHLSVKSQASLNIALITCMMFICLELLRGEFKSANTHLQNGMNILSQVQGRGTHDNTLTVRPDPQSVDDYLIEAYARLNIQSAVFGLGSRHLYILAQDLTCGLDSQFQIPSTFPSIYEARKYLDGLLNRVLHLVEESRDLPLASHQPISNLLIRQSNLQTSLTSWLTAYDASTPSLLLHLTPRIVFGLPILRIYHTMTSIMLRTAFSIQETAYDSLTSSFQSIITQCINIENVDLVDLGIKYPTSTFCKEMNIRFTVDMGFIPPLYYTALKCRDPVIRRKAISFLRIAPHREGMWDPIIVSKVGQKIMEMEEGDFFRGVDIDYWDATVGELRMPPLPEAARLSDVKVIMSETLKGAGTLVYKRCRHTHEGHNEWEVEKESFAFGHEVNNRTRNGPHKQTHGTLSWGRCATVQHLVSQRERRK